MSGRALYSRGFVEALFDFNFVIELGTGAGLKQWAHTARGLLLADVGGYTASIWDHNQAIQLRPQHVAAYVNRGRTYALMGDTDNAIADYTQALTLDSSLSTAWLNRGTEYLAIDDPNQAVSDYTQALKLNPDDTLALAYRDSSQSRRRAV